MVDLPTNTQRDPVLLCRDAGACVETSRAKVRDMLALIDRLFIFLMCVALAAITFAPFWMVWMK